MIGTLIVLILGIIILAVLWFFIRNVVHLVINSILGIALLFIVNLINLFGIIGKPPVPINLISIIVCALAGIPGAILLMLLHIVGLF
jgi:hypothetical protein